MSVIDEVKLKLDIVQVVSEYVKLQKAGRNYKSACPFHSEKDPSFFVFPERQSWHCFGACGTGGDIFSFIMKKEGVDFAQALRLLAAKAGVALVEQTGPRRETESRERESLFEINEAAAAYYHHLLLKSSPAEAARNYVNGRGISIETIKDFQIGYAPEGWDTIKEYLKGKGYTEAELITVGLLVEGENKKSYDRFRNRLMFPIRDIQGKVTGFGGRALDDSLPKYLNSPQTPIFDKSRSLYGIDKAKTAIRQKDMVIITEGYIDVLTAHQYGYDNVVAFSGTAMVATQLAISKMLSGNVVLALDADAAGKEAISRSGEMLDNELQKPSGDYGWVKYEDAHRRAEVKVLELPEGKDLDDEIRDIIKDDTSKWQNILATAKPMVDFIFESAVAKLNLESARDKSTAVEKLMPLLNEMKDPLRQAHYLERLAKLLKIDQHVLGDALRKFQASQKRRKGYEGAKSTTTASAAVVSSSPLEQYCLALLFQYPELRSECKQLTSEHFENTENRELFDKWQLCNNPDLLKENLDTTLAEHLNNLMSRQFEPLLAEKEAVRRQAIEECVVRLEERRLRNLELQKQELLTIEASIGGTDRQLAKLEEGLEIPKQLKEIFVKQNNRHRQIKSEG